MMGTGSVVWYRWACARADTPWQRIDFEGQTIGAAALVQRVSEREHLERGVRRFMFRVVIADAVTGESIAADDDESRVANGARIVVKRVPCQQRARPRG